MRGSRALWYLAQEGLIKQSKPADVAERMGVGWCSVHSHGAVNAVSQFSIKFPYATSASFSAVFTKSFLTFLHTHHFKGRSLTRRLGLLFLFFIHHNIFTTIHTIA